MKKILFIVLSLIAITSFGQDDFWFGSYPQTGLPIVQLNSINVTHSYCAQIGSAEVLSDCGNAVTERGIAYGYSTNPTISGNHIVSGSGVGTFTATTVVYSTDFVNRNYYYRAYATNSKGTAYSNTIIVFIKDTVHVTSSDAYNIQSSSAMSDINIVYNDLESGSSVYGYYKESGGSSYTEFSIAIAEGDSQESIVFQGLNPSTTYDYYFQVRTYCGDFNTNIKQFTTLASSSDFTTPTVLTTTASNIGNTTASSGGNVTNSGNMTIIERGVVVRNISAGVPNYSTYDIKTNDGTGTGSFSSSITNLTAGTTYGYRAYARGRFFTGGIYVYSVGYGDLYQFSTTGGVLPTVYISGISNIQQTSVTIEGNVSDSGGSDVINRGVCYSTSQNPTISNNKTSNGVGTGYFTAYISGLNSSTTYYARAYAINSTGVSYSQQISFITSSPGNIPTVTSTNYSNLSTTSVDLSANLASNGSGTIIEKGFCYSTINTNPNINNSKLISQGTSLGVFNENLSGLIPATTYYARAYAINEYGVGYSNQISFTTLCNLPSFIAASCNTTGSYSIDVSATISSDGGCPVTSRGFQYSTDASFNTILGSVTASGTGTGQYYSTISNLNCGVHYYFRPWATNSAGTYYATSLVGTGCSTISHPEYTLTSGFFYSITSSTCFSGDFTSSFNSACNAKAEYFNTSVCHASLIGRSYRTQSGTLNVGDKLYYFDGCEVNTTGYELNNDYNVVYILNGVIQSITPCP